MLRAAAVGLIALAAVDTYFLGGKYLDTVEAVARSPIQASAIRSTKPRAPALWRLKLRPLAARLVGRSPLGILIGSANRSSEATLVG